MSLKECSDVQGNSQREKSSETYDLIPLSETDRVDPEILKILSFEKFEDFEGSETRGEISKGKKNKNCRDFEEQDEDDDEDNTTGMVKNDGELKEYGKNENSDHNVMDAYEIDADEGDMEVADEWKEEVADEGYVEVDDEWNENNDHVVMDADEIDADEGDKDMEVADEWKEDTADEGDIEAADELKEEVADELNEKVDDELNEEVTDELNEEVADEWNKKVAEVDENKEITDEEDEEISEDDEDKEDAKEDDEDSDEFFEDNGDEWYEVEEDDYEWEDIEEKEYDEDEDDVYGEYKDEDEEYGEDKDEDKEYGEEKDEDEEYGGDKDEYEEYDEDKDEDEKYDEDKDEDEEYDENKDEDKKDPKNLGLKRKKLNELVKWNVLKRMKLTKKMMGYTDDDETEQINDTVDFYEGKTEEISCVEDFDEEKNEEINNLQDFDKDNTEEINEVEDILNKMEEFTKNKYENADDIVKVEQDKDQCSMVEDMCVNHSPWSSKFSIKPSNKEKQNYIIDSKMSKSSEVSSIERCKLGPLQKPQMDSRQKLEDKPQTRWVSPSDELTIEHIHRNVIEQFQKFPENGRNLLTQRYFEQEKRESPSVISSATVIPTHSNACSFPSPSNSSPSTHFISLQSIVEPNSPKISTNILKTQGEKYESEEKSIALTKIESELSISKVNHEIEQENLIKGEDDKMSTEIIHEADRSNLLSRTSDNSVVSSENTLSNFLTKMESELSLSKDKLEIEQENSIKVHIEEDKMNTNVIQKEDRSNLLSCTSNNTVVSSEDTYIGYGSSLVSPVINTDLTLTISTQPTVTHDGSTSTRCDDFSLKNQRELNEKENISDAKCIGKLKEKNLASESLRTEVGKELELDEVTFVADQEKELALKTRSLAELNDYWVKFGVFFEKAKEAIVEVKESVDKATKKIEKMNEAYNKIKVAFDASRCFLSSKKI